MVRHDVDLQHPPLTSPGLHDAVSDATLVANAQHDLSAFTALYERYADPVLRYCFHRLGTWSEAEDAVAVLTTARVSRRRRIQVTESRARLKPKP